MLEEQEKMTTGLRRYAMIDDLVGVELAYGEKSALLEDLAQAHGISVSALKRYLKQYARDGFEGLLPKTRADKGLARAITPEALEMASKLRRELPSRSTPTIIRMLAAQEPRWESIRRSTLDEHFRRLGLTRQLLRQEQKVRRKFAKTRRNLLWQADICIPRLWVRDNQGEKHQAVVVAAIDDCTRRIVHAECFDSQEAWVVETILKKAMTKHGLPASLYIDNGAQFVARQIREACQKLGVRFIRACPRDAAGKGKIERWFASMQGSFVPEMQAFSALPTLVELNRYFWAWVEEHYHQAVHSELAETPLDRWDKDPTPLRMVDPITLEGAFLLAAERTVSKTSLITLDGQEYLVDDRLAGRRVEVRYHPRERQQVQIWRQGKFVQVATPYQVPGNSPKVRENRAARKQDPTGLNYVQQLDRQRQGKLRQKVESLTTGLTEPQLFVEADFLYLLEACLHPLTDQEKGWAYATWKDAGGLEKEKCERALKTFIASRGRDRHVSYYLDAVLRAHRTVWEDDSHV